MLTKLYAIFYLFNFISFFHQLYSSPIKDKLLFKRQAIPDLSSLSGKLPAAAQGLAGQIPQGLPGAAGQLPQGLAGAAGQLPQGLGPIAQTATFGQNVPNQPTGQQLPAGPSQVGTLPVAGIPGCPYPCEQRVPANLVYPNQQYYVRPDPWTDENNYPKWYEQFDVQGTAGWLRDQFFWNPLQSGKK